MNMLGIVVAFATAAAAVYVWVAPRRRSPPPSGGGAAFVDPDAEASLPTDEGIPHPAAHAGD